MELMWTKSWDRQEGWVPTSARHGVPLSYKGKHLLLGAAPALSSAATGKAGGNSSWTTPSPVVLAGAWHHQQLCSAAEAVLSSGSCSATLSGGIGIPKIQTAEMTHSSMPHTSEMGLTKSKEATSHQLIILKYGLSYPHLMLKMWNIGVWETSRFSENR